MSPNKNSCHPKCHQAGVAEKNKKFSKKPSRSSTWHNCTTRNFAHKKGERKTLPEATPLFDAKWRRRGGDLFKNVHLTPPPRLYRTTVENSKYNRPASNSQMPNLFIVASPPLPAPVLIRKNANHPPPLSFHLSLYSFFLEFPCEVTPGKLCFCHFRQFEVQVCSSMYSCFIFLGNSMFE